MSRRSSCLRIALAIAAVGVPALAVAQDDPAPQAPVVSADKLPTAPELRINRTTGYGAQMRGGQYLNAPGTAGSVGLSNTKAQIKSANAAASSTAVSGMGATATGTPGYGGLGAGAATAYHHLPEVKEAPDVLTPQARSARAILPGTHQPFVGNPAAGPQ